MDIHPSIFPSAHLFVHSSIRPSVCPFIGSFIRLLIHWLVGCFVHWFAYLLVVCLLVGLFGRWVGGLVEFLLWIILSTPVSTTSTPQTEPVSCLHYFTTRTTLTVHQDYKYNV